METADKRIYDVLIIGAGPAGMTAAIYAARAGMKAAALEALFAGGQITAAPEVENYPGFESISGYDLAVKMADQMKKAGAEMYSDEITSLEKSADGLFAVKGSSDTYYSRAVIIATGAHRRELGAEGETRLAGAGVSYCATCDGSLFRGKTVAVIGGGNTAVDDALYLSNICGKVYLIHRREQFRASKAETDKLARPNIELRLGCTVPRITGEAQVEGIVLSGHGGEENLACDAVFIAVGTVPATAFLPPEIARDAAGYVITDERLQTSMAGVFAAGDVRSSSLKQAVCAASDGARAAIFAGEYINR